MTGWDDDAPAGPTQLGPGESLLPGQFLSSPDDSARLVLGEDGTLAVWKKGDKKPASQLHKKKNGSMLTMQDDSNAVLYEANGKPAGWTSASNGKGAGGVLTLTEEGVLRVTSADGAVIYASDGKGAAVPAKPQAGPATVEAGEGTVEAQSIVEAPPPEAKPLSMDSASNPDAAGAPIEVFAEKKDAWEQDGKWLYKYEVYVRNTGEHNITKLDMAVPHEGITYQTWGCHDRGDAGGRRVFELPENVLGNGGIRANETYAFGGVFSEESPGFTLAAWEAPS
jgi:hypothetical protein